MWHGECLGLQWQGALLGDATWNLAPGRALTGSLSGDLELRGTAVNLRTDLDTNFSGVGELRNLNARLVLDPALLPQFPPDQRGTVTAQFERLELADRTHAARAAGDRRSCTTFARSAHSRWSSALTR